MAQNRTAKLKVRHPNPSAEPKALIAGLTTPAVQDWLVGTLFFFSSFF